MPFADSEDVHAEDILAANHVPLTAEGLQAALDSGIEVAPGRRRPRRRRAR